MEIERDVSSAKKYITVVIVDVGNSDWRRFNVFFWPLFGVMIVLFKNFTEKVVGYSVIRTRIVRVECKHADDLTSNTAIADYMFTPS